MCSKPAQFTANWFIFSLFWIMVTQSTNMLALIAIICKF